MYYLSPVYFANQPLHVSGMFIAHHHEVYCIYHTEVSRCTVNRTYNVTVHFGVSLHCVYCLTEKGFLRSIELENVRKSSNHKHNIALSKLVLELIPYFLLVQFLYSFILPRYKNACYIGSLLKLHLISKYTTKSEHVPTPRVIHDCFYLFLMCNNRMDDKR